jgi:hypothetical protein
MQNYRYGLCTRARLLCDMRCLLARFESDPLGFAASFGRRST